MKKLHVSGILTCPSKWSNPQKQWDMKMSQNLSSWSFLLMRMWKLPALCCFTLLYCDSLGEPADSSHHQGQPPQWTAHVLFPQLFVFDGCLPHLHSGTQIDHWLACPAEDHLLQQLHDPDFYAYFFGATEIFILVAMAYDLYATICRPLHCMVIMNRQVCYVLVMASAMGAFSHSIMQVLIIIGLPFCGPNQIDHYFCDIFPLPAWTLDCGWLQSLLLQGCCPCWPLLPWWFLTSSSCPSWGLPHPRAATKPSPPVVHTSLWSSCSSCPSSSPMSPRLILSGTTRFLPCFTPWLPPCSTLSSTPRETQTCRMPWRKCGAEIKSLQENEASGCPALCRI